MDLFKHEHIQADILNSQGQCNADQDFLHSTSLLLHLILYSDIILITLLPSPPQKKAFNL